MTPRRRVQIIACIAAVAWAGLAAVDFLAAVGYLPWLPIPLHTLVAAVLVTATILAAARIATAAILAAWRRREAPVEAAFLLGALRERANPGEMPLKVDTEPETWPMASGDDTGGGRADQFKRDGGRVLEFQRPGGGAHRPRPAAHPRDPRRR